MDVLNQRTNTHGDFNASQGPGFGQVAKPMVYCFMYLKVQGIDCMTALGFRIQVTGLVFYSYVDIPGPEPSSYLRPKT